MCTHLDPSDVTVQGTGILSMFGRSDAFGPSTKLPAQPTFMSNKTGKDIILPDKMLH
jgi:hypothetical protein